VFPDRTPHPSLFEVKKVYQNVKALPADLEKGVVEIVNRHAFTNLAPFELRWSVSADGETLGEGTVADLDVPPGESRRFTLPWRPPSPAPDTEYWLRVSFHTKVETPLVPKGWEVAFDQFLLPVEAPKPHALSPTDIPPLSLDDSDGRITLSGTDFSVAIDRATGLIASYSYRGKDILSSGPKPHFWRAPIDNDVGNRMPDRCGIWRDAGDRMNVRDVTVDRPHDGMAVVTVDAALPTVQSSYTITYAVYGTGDVIVGNRFTPGGKELPELMRYGMRMTVAGGLETMTWYGRGPHESHWDRKTGAAVGVYSGAVDDQFVPYVRPQENGNKTDVRWVSLTGPDGVGLLAVGMPTLSVSAHHYTAEDFEKADHPYELARRDDITLNLDYRQTGVGGDNSWGARPHPEYTLYPKEYSYRFRIRGFDRDEEEERELAKRHQREISSFKHVIVVYFMIFF